MPLATREDVEIRFGKANVAVWADLDNTKQDDVIAARVAWALETAENEVYGALRNGLYPIPFEEPYPPEIVDVVAMKAGVLLHDLRGGDDEDSIKAQRKIAKSTILRIISGQLILAGITTARMTPGVVKDSGCGCGPKCKTGYPVDSRPWRLQQ